MSSDLPDRADSPLSALDELHARIEQMQRELVVSPLSLTTNDGSFISPEELPSEAAGVAGDIIKASWIRAIELRHIAQSELQQARDLVAEAQANSRLAQQEAEALRQEARFRHDALIRDAQAYLDAAVSGTRDMIAEAGRLAEDTASKIVGGKLDELAEQLRAADEVESRLTALRYGTAEEGAMADQTRQVEAETDDLLARLSLHRAEAESLRAQLEELTREPVPEPLAQASVFGASAEWVTAPEVAIHSESPVVATTSSSTPSAIATVVETVVETPAPPAPRDYQPPVVLPEYRDPDDVDRARSRVWPRVISVVLLIVAAGAAVAAVAYLNM